MKKEKGKVGTRTNEAGVERALPEGA